MRIATPTTRRPAFTLIELLVVITFIGILAALTASATMRIMGVQQSKNTEGGIQKLYSLFEQHWKAVIAKANTDSTVHLNATKLAGGDARRARVIYVKMMLKQQFPVTFEEVLTPGPYDLPPVETYRQAISGSVFANDTERAERQSALLLLLALSQARAGVTMNAETVINSLETLATNKPDVKVIADGWGKPLLFSRWPIEDAELNPRGLEPIPPIRDTEDPLGLLAEPAWVAGPGVEFGRYFHPVGARMQFRLVPTIMSWGPDKDHGLLNPITLKPGSAAANDNLYSYRLRLGASGQ